MNDFETTYPSAKFAGSGYSRRRGTGTTSFVVAAACVNGGFSVPPDRPAGWSSPVEGIDWLPSHAESLRLAERVTVVGSPGIPPLAPRLTVRLTDGTFFGAMVRRIDPDSYQNYFASVALAEGTAIALFDRDSKMLARYPHVEAMIGTSYKNAPLMQKVLTDGGQQTLRVTSPFDGLSFTLGAEQ